MSYVFLVRCNGWHHYVKRTSEQINKQTNAKTKQTKKTNTITQTNTNTLSLHVETGPLNIFPKALHGQYEHDQSRGQKKRWQECFYKKFIYLFQKALRLYSLNVFFFLLLMLSCFFNICFSQDPIIGFYLGADRNIPFA